MRIRIENKIFNVKQKDSDWLLAFYQDEDFEYEASLNLSNNDSRSIALKNGYVLSLFESRSKYHDLFMKAFVYFQQHPASHKDDIVHDYGALGSTSPHEA